MAVQVSAPNTELYRRLDAAKAVLDRVFDAEIEKRQKNIKQRKKRVKVRPPVDVAFSLQQMDEKLVEKRRRQREAKRVCDGALEKMKARARRLRRGDRLQAMCGARWFPGVVAAIGDFTLQVLFDDGSMQYFNLEMESHKLKPGPKKRALPNVPKMEDETKLGAGTGLAAEEQNAEAGAEAEVEAGPESVAEPEGEPEPEPELALRQKSSLLSMVQSEYSSAAVRRGNIFAELVRRRKALQRAFDVADPSKTMQLETSAFSRLLLQLDIGESSEHFNINAYAISVSYCKCAGEHYRDTSRTATIGCAAGFCHRRVHTIPIFAGGNWRVERGESRKSSTG
jgi:hypothetical protein